MKIMKKLDDSILFPCGRKMKNRFMLSPLTNTQSNEDGTLSSEEFDWLTMRAKGQFGLVITCASHVQEVEDAMLFQGNISRSKSTLTSAA